MVGKEKEKKDVLTSADGVIWKCVSNEGWRSSLAEKESLLFFPKLFGRNKRICLN